MQLCTLVVQGHVSDILLQDHKGQEETHKQPANPDANPISEQVSVFLYYMLLETLMCLIHGSYNNPHLCF